MRIHRDERGQTIILVALSLPLMLGFIGIATDVGALFKVKRTMQTAADAAAIAGALNLNYGASVWKPAAKAASALNGYTDGSNGVTVRTPDTPQWPASNYNGKSGYTEVTITKTESTIFLALFGHPSVTVLARAVATNQAPGSGCVFTLGSSGPDLSINGNVDLDAQDCSLNIDSNTPDAISTSGNAYSVKTASTGVVATSISSGTSKFSPAPVTGIVPYSDPLSYYPQYACAKTGCTCTSNCANNPVIPLPASCGKATGSTLSPGCYNGLAIGNGSVTLNSGVYFFNGDITINGNGSLTGSGVTLIMTSGSIPKVKGTETMNLTAPGSGGAFPGLLYYQVASDNSPIQFGGNASSTLHGVIYAPTADITLQGTPGANTYTDFVVKTIHLGGNAGFHNFAALPGGAGGLTSIALVE